MTNSEPSAIPQPATFPTSSDSDFDFVVIGSGFAGSLLATILQTQGRRVAIIDRTSHPRFAIGESSTPAAGLILSSLADQYELAWLKPFAKYGTWKATYPDITTGRKRGFSYFHHEAGKPFQPRPDHANELLAAASSSDELSDTQWLRSDVDAFFFKKACESGIVPFENSEITSLTRNQNRWLVVARESSESSGVKTETLSADFLIDASGAGQVLARHLDIKDQSEQLTTNSRAIFAHVTGLPEWQSILEQTAPGSTSDHPFHCDHAAQHHVLDEGWMWWLRFDSDVTSVGLVIDNRSSSAFTGTIRSLGENHTRKKTDGWGRASASPQQAGLFGGSLKLDPSHPTPKISHQSTEFFRIISRYPSLSDAFSSATVVAPLDQPIETRRLQRLAAQIAGNDWAMLPHTAGFIDPLHSTGIAHSLAGVERLAAILLARDPTVSNASPDSILQLYGSIIRQELTLIDELVAGCYDAIKEGSFRKLAAFTMCYFAAATTWERQRLNDKSALTSNSSPNPVTLSVSEGHNSLQNENSDPSLTRRVTMPSGFEHSALLCADDADFLSAVVKLRKRMPDETDESFETLCKETLAPFNHVGLFEPPIPNMYGGTALPADEEHRTANVQRSTSK